MYFVVESIYSVLVKQKYSDNQNNLIEVYLLSILCTFLSIRDSLLKRNNILPFDLTGV